MLLEKIEYWAKNQGDTIAYLPSQGPPLSYFELWNRSCRLAQKIQYDFPNNHSPIVVWGHKEIWMPICFLACVLAGHPYVPLDISCPLPRVTDIINQANPACLISLPDYQHSSIPTWNLSTIEQHSTGDFPLDNFQFPLEDDIFYIIFTSGTTGVPKGVCITYKNLQTFLDWMLEIPAVSEIQGDVILNQSILSFDLSVADLYYGFYVGKTVYALEKKIQQDFPLLFQALKNSHASLAVMTPSFAEYCMLDSSFAQTLLPQLECCYFCGETLSKNTVKKLWDRFPTLRIINAYGPTEATVSATYTEILPFMLQYKTLPIGFYDQQVELAETKEIILWGENICAGYWNLSCDNFFLHNGKSYYHTGDYGFFEKGYLFYSGRLDSQVKIQGHRIELMEIENCFRSLADIKNVAVTTQQLHNQLCIVAYVQSDVEIKKLKKMAQSLLPSYMVPYKIIRIDSIPLNENGKCDFLALEGVSKK